MGFALYSARQVLQPMEFMLSFTFFIPSLSKKRAAAEMTYASVSGACEPYTSMPHW